MLNFIAQRKEEITYCRCGGRHECGDAASALSEFEAGDILKC